MYRSTRWSCRHFLFGLVLPCAVTPTLAITADERLEYAEDLFWAEDYDRALEGFEAALAELPEGVLVHRFWTLKKVHVGRRIEQVGVYWLRARMWRIADVARRFQSRGRGILRGIGASENFG